MAVLVSTLKMEKYPQFCSSVVKSAISAFNGRSVSIFRKGTN